MTGAILCCIYRKEVSHMSALFLILATGLLLVIVVAVVIAIVSALSAAIATEGGADPE